MFRVLITQDPSFPQVEVTGEDGADAEFRRGADYGEGGGFDSFFARALSFLPAPEGKPFGPAEVVTVVVTDEFHLAVIRRWCRGMRMGMRGQGDDFLGFWAPTRQQMPALQSAKARVPDQNQSSPVENFR